MKSIFERLRARRLASTFVVLATVFLPRLSGAPSSLNGVRGQEKQNESTDATPLHVVNSSVPPNEFVRIAKEVGPAVVNINTETLPAVDTNRRRNPHGLQQMPQNPGGGGDDDQNGEQPGQGQGKVRVKIISRISSTASLAARSLIRTAEGKTDRCVNRSVPVHRGFQGIHHHQQPRHREGRQDLRQAFHRSRYSGPGRPARVIGTDKATDLAVIKIDANSPLPTVKLGNSETPKSRLRQSDRKSVCLLATVTAGIISAKHRTIEPVRAASSSTSYRPMRRSTPATPAVRC